MIRFQDGERDQIERILQTLMKTSEAKGLLLISREAHLLDLRCRQPIFQQSSLFIEKIANGWNTLQNASSFCPLSALYEGQTNSLLVGDVGHLILSLVFPPSLEDELLEAYQLAAVQLQMIITPPAKSPPQPPPVTSESACKPLTAKLPLIPAGWPPTEEECLDEEDLLKIEETLATLSHAHTIYFLGKEGKILLQIGTELLGSDIVLAFINQTHSIAQEWGAGFAQQEIFKRHIYRNHQHAILFYNTSESTSLVMICDAEEVALLRWEVGKSAPLIKKIMHNAWERMNTATPKTNMSADEHIDWDILLRSEEESYFEQLLSLSKELPDLGPGPEEVKALLYAFLKRSGAQGVALFDRLGQMVGEEGEAVKNPAALFAHLPSKCLTAATYDPACFTYYQDEAQTFLLGNIAGALLAIAFEPDQENKIRQALQLMSTQIMEIAAQFGHGASELPPTIAVAPSLNPDIIAQVRGALEQLSRTVGAKGSFLFTREGNKITGYGEINDEIDTIITFSSGTWEDILPQTAAFDSQLFQGRQHSIWVTKIALHYLLVIIFSPEHETAVRQKALECGQVLTEIIAGAHLQSGVHLQTDSTCQKKGKNFDKRSITKKLYAFKETHDVDGVFLLNERGEALIGLPEQEHLPASLAMAAGGWTAAGRPEGVILQQSNGRSLLMTGIGQYLLTTVCQGSKEPKVRTALGHLASGLAPLLVVEEEKADANPINSTLWHAQVVFPSRIPVGKWQTLHLSFSPARDQIRSSSQQGSSCVFQLASRSAPLEISLASQIFEIRQDSWREVKLPSQGPVLYHIRGFTTGAAKLSMELFQAEQYLGSITISTFLF